MKLLLFRKVYDNVRCVKRIKTIKIQINYNKVIKISIF